MRSPLRQIHLLRERPKLRYIDPLRVRSEILELRIQGRGSDSNGMIPPLGRVLLAAGLLRLLLHGLHLFRRKALPVLLEARARDNIRSTKDYLAVLLDYIEIKFLCCGRYTPSLDITAGRRCPGCRAPDAGAAVEGGGCGLLC